MRNLFFFAFIISGVATILAFSAAPAPANDTLSCAPWPRAVKMLAGTYGEIAVGAGVTKSEEATILFLNPVTRTYTVISRSKDGEVACIIAAGKNFLPMQHPTRGIEG